MVDLLPADIAEMEGEERPEEENGMSDMAYTSAIKDRVSDSESWIEQDISPDREKAHRYYNGECDLPAQKNRSKFVMRVARDTIEQTVPQPLRIFTGGTDVVAFLTGSMNPQRQKLAQDETVAVRALLWNKNPGCTNMQHSCGDDGRANMGWVKSTGKEE